MIVLNITTRASNLEDDGTGEVGSHNTDPIDMLS